MIEIPKQLQNPEFRFLLLRKKDKKPLELEWQKKNNYKFDDEKLLNHIKTGANYGIIGGFGNLVLIDVDSEEINEKCKLLPDTFKVKTGSPEEYKNHYFFISDEPLNPIRLSKEKVGDIGDIRSTGQYVVAPNSIHPKGNPYKVVDDLPISKISVAFLKSIFKDYIDTISSVNKEIKNKPDYKIDTTKRLSAFVKNCKIPDYILNNKLPDNISKNWTLFPYVIDVLNSRDVLDKLYEKLAEMQDHNIGAVKGWVKSAKEGTLAKTSCKKMREYINHYIPELSDNICSGCPLYEKLKKEEKKNQEEELKNKLLQEHKEKISTDTEVLKLLKDKEILELFNKEFDKKIVKEFETRKTLFLINNMCNVENLNKATDNIMLNAPSGVGKDYISEAIFDIFPEEEKEELIRTTPKVLAYTRNSLEDPKATWKKVRLRLEDAGNDVLNDDCFKVISSSNPNKKNKAKSVQKGKVIEIEIDGKPTITLTIATANPKEEILRRFPICDLDEGINQTKEILKRQSQFAVSGKTIDYDEKFTDALRLLKRVRVKVPFAEKLVEIFCPENVIVRTHFPRFLDYIKSSCSFHQYQRTQDEEGYFLAEKQDYDIARMMLIKTTSNIFMIPLTQLLQKIMKVFEDDELQRKSVDDLQEFEGIKKLNIDIEWLRKKLNWLVSKGFLSRDSEKRFKEDGRPIPKPIYVYSYNKLQRLEIPKWEEISSFTQDYKNTTNSSNTTNTGVIVVNEVNEYQRDKKNNKKEQKNIPEWSESDKKRLAYAEGNLEEFA
jgi:hypothetical protein